MKTYSVQERTQELLHMLRTHKGVRISGMAEKLSVTERTIRNDLAGLEKDLAGIASVSRKQGICSLDVTDPAGLDRFASRMAAQTDQGLPEADWQRVYAACVQTAFYGSGDCPSGPSSGPAA